MSDLISRDDAIRELSGVCSNWEDDAKVAEIINALPSAEAVSMEEHIKELNDLAVEWKAKFAKAEKITDEIYDETMAKVAKECEECKERLRNIRPSAEAVQGEWKIDEYGIYHCPFCHAINNTVYKSFCPNCGARMKGGDKDD